MAGVRRRQEALGSHRLAVGVHLTRPSRCAQIRRGASVSPTPTLPAEASQRSSTLVLCSGFTFGVWTPW